MAFYDSSILTFIFRINRDFAFPAAKGFKVYWNVPTFLCHRHGINFKPHTKKFGIISNAKDSFRGKEINILYDPGLFPAVMKVRISGIIEINYVSLIKKY